jgi:hypothetical protein
MISPNHHTRNGGFTLTEVLVFGVMLMIIVNAGVRISLSASRIGAINTLAKDRLIATQTLDTAFRDAVRGASGMLDSAGAYHTSENVVILRLHDDNHIRVVGTALHPKQFSVLDMELRDGVWELTDLRNQSIPINNVRIVPAADSSLLQLEYEVKPERGERMRDPMTHTVLANMQCSPVEVAP